MDSLQAQLLIAVPQLPDSNFYRTVVLMIQHDDDGALGVVLNRPSNITIKDIWEKVADEPSDRDDAIHLGGPVQGPIIAVHVDAACADGDIMPGVYVATDRDNLDQLVRNTGEPLRLFIGYSGWGEGQLEDELDAGGWLTTPAKHEYIFHDDEDLWKTVTDDIGKEVLFNQLDIHDAPDDPSLN